MARGLKVLIVDDLVRARQAISVLLKTCPQVGALREACNGREAVCVAGEWLPDVIVMDVRMPEMDGIAATRIIKSRWPGIKTILLSMYGDAEHEALAAGADAFVNKGEPSEGLRRALAAVAGTPG